VNGPYQEFPIRTSGVYTGGMSLSIGLCLPLLTIFPRLPWCRSCCYQHQLPVCWCHYTHWSFWQQLRWLHWNQLEYHDYQYIVLQRCVARK
jgi:hypothetical protein